MEGVAYVAYVAQHAFNHIENHLDISTNEHIRWRYANGNDREDSRRPPTL